MAAVTIFSMLLVFTPKPANGIILISAIFQGLLAQYTLTSLLVDTLITCVLASCGSGDGQNGGQCNIGGPCTISICGDSVPGNIQEGDGGECGCTPNDPNIDINDQCSIYPLGDPPLTITPAILRTGDTATITWDIGENSAADCTLQGPHLDILEIADTVTTDGVGSVDVTVTGPHVYTLTCSVDGESETASAQVRIAGESIDS